MIRQVSRLELKVLVPVLSMTPSKKEQPAWCPGARLATFFTEN
jgi:hypothetical protein